MNWTKSPSAEGWHWVYDSYHDFYECLEVYDRDGLCVEQQDSRSPSGVRWNPVTDHYFKECLWSGPIVPPEKP